MKKFVATFALVGFVISFCVSIFFASTAASDWKDAKEGAGYATLGVSDADLDYLVWSPQVFDDATEKLGFSKDAVPLIDVAEFEELQAVYFAYMRMSADQVDESVTVLSWPERLQAIDQKFAQDGNENGLQLISTIKKQWGDYEVTGVEATKLIEDQYAADVDEMVSDLWTTAYVATAVAGLFLVLAVISAAPTPLTSLLMFISGAVGAMAATSGTLMGKAGDFVYAYTDQYLGLRQASVLFDQPGLEPYLFVVLFAAVVAYVFHLYAPRMEGDVTV